MEKKIKNILSNLTENTELSKIGNYLIDVLEKESESDFQENLNDFLFLLYVNDNKSEILQFSDYFYNYPITPDKRIWSFVESSLTLIARIYREESNEDSSRMFVEKIKIAFNTGNDLVLQVNAKARQRRLNGETLNQDKITESIKNGDKQSEFDYRLVQLKKLFFISELGYSQEMTEDKVEEKIKSDLEFLKNNIY